MFYHNKEDVNVIDGINECLNIVFRFFFFFLIFWYEFLMYGGTCG